MKKTVYYILSVVALMLVGFTSCDVTRDPVATPLQAPFKGMQDVAMNRDAIYALLSNIESPNTLNYPDIQSDLFMVTQFDNNSVLPFYSWQRSSVLDNDYVLNYYFGCYYSLMETNYFLMRAQEFLDNEEISKSEEDVALVKQYIGEAKVIRALAHWRVVQRFSRPWDGTTDGERTNGIIVMDKYDPVGTAKEPKRSRADVYALIYQDLDEAIAAIPADANKDVKPAIYITQDYAYAVKARAALTRQDWATAQACAQHVIDRYPLSPKDEIHRLWVTEDSPEILVRLYATPSIGGTTSYLYAGGFFDTHDKHGSPVRLYYRRPILVINKMVEDLYSSSDVRKTAFIGPDFFNLSDALDKVYEPMLAIKKFAGNPSLNKDKTRPEHKFGIHLFNVGEAYLICAEACAHQGDLDGAVQNLKKLSDARGATLATDDIIDPEAAINEILRERMRELIGEGFRMNDLVRLRLGMQRKSGPQTVLNAAAVKGDGANLEISPDDEMMIWEFPTRDRNQNPDLWKHPNWSAAAN